MTMMKQSIDKEAKKKKKKKKKTKVVVEKVMMQTMTTMMEAPRVSESQHAALAVTAAAAGWGCWRNDDSGVSRFFLRPPLLQWRRSMLPGVRKSSTSSSFLNGKGLDTLR